MTEQKYILASERVLSGRERIEITQSIRGAYLIWSELQSSQETPSTLSFSYTLYCTELVPERRDWLKDTMHLEVTDASEHQNSLTSRLQNPDFRGENRT